MARGIGGADDDARDGLRELTFIRRYREEVPLEVIARFARSASWPFADQALISAANFLGMVIAARTFTTADFGLYALAYSLMWAFNTVQNSLITQPFGVLAAGRDLDGYRRYASGTGVMQIVLVAVITVPVLVVGVVYGRPRGTGLILLSSDSR